MEKEILKKDAHTLTVTTTTPVSSDFTVEYLKSQREAILAQKGRDNTQRDLELAEIDAYLAEATRLGIVEEIILRE